MQRGSEIGLLTYLAAGEFAALYALAAQRSADVLFGLTAGAVATAFLALGTVALLGSPPSR